MKISPLFSKVAWSVGIFALAAMIGLPVFKTLADNIPRFNQMQGDQEFLTARNSTQAQAGWTDPVAAADGDLVDVKVWYHNDANNPDGSPGATATNTVVKIALPTTDAQSHIITGSIGADNAATVTGTIVNGVEVGQPGATINTALPTTVEFVPGSVRWFANGANTPSVLPNGQAGDEIVSATGISLGDIQGCWPFVGAIQFQVRVKPAGQPNLLRAKTAVNLTQGNVNATTVKAKAGDQIQYTLTTKNTGNRPATALIVNDDVRDVLQYADLVSASDDGVLSNGLIAYPAVDLAPNQSIARTFTVKVKPEAQWPTTGDLTMTNVYGDRVDVPLLPTPLQADLTIDKQVKNVVSGSTYAQETAAKVGDQVSYRIVITNTAAASLTGVTISDQLPANLDFMKGTVVVTRDGRSFAITDSQFANGYRLDTPLLSGTSVTLTFSATVAQTAAVNSRLTNVATVKSDQTGQRQDDAVVTIQGATVTPPATTTTPTTPKPGTPTLPTTGAGDAGLMIIGMLTSGATALRYKFAQRSLARAARSVTVR